MPKKPHQEADQGQKTIEQIPLADLIPHRKHGYTRDRTCVVCGKTETIRKDNRSDTCRLCTCRKSLTKGRAKIIANAPRKKCKGCGAEMRALLPWNYCSVACRKKDKRESRHCRKCGSMFQVMKSQMNGKTNASGVFCSKDCYWEYLCDHEKVSGRGSQWKRISRRAVMMTPFCACCGRTSMLQVHHIIPYRRTMDNRQENLIPLCVKCHKRIEYTIYPMIDAGISDQDIWMFFHNELHSLRNVHLASALEVIRGH